MDFEITYSSVNLQGDRPYQEDSVKVYLDPVTNEGVFAVADGLGGHGHGEEASFNAVEISVEKWQQCREDFDSGSYFGDVFPEVNHRLVEIQDENKNPNGWKTTLVLGTIQKDRKFYLAHIGDTRCYVFRRGEDYWRTQDHSVPQLLVMTGEITEKQIRKHPDRNRLLKVLGTRDGDPAFTGSDPFDVESGMTILMCTDGFWELITEKWMQWHLFWAKDVEDWMNRMVKHVQKQGKDLDMDNFSAVGIWIR